MALFLQSVASRAVTMSETAVAAGPGCCQRLEQMNATGQLWCSSWEKAHQKHTHGERAHRCKVNNMGCGGL
jgi:hypothetical protein